MALFKVKKIKFVRSNSNVGLVFVVALAIITSTVKTEDAKPAVAAPIITNATITIPPEAGSVASKTVKKMLETFPEEIVISEKTLTELQADAKKKTEAAAAIKESEKPATANSFSSSLKDSNLKQKIFPPDDDAEMPDSFKTGFYIFLALSCGAVMFIVFKVYRLRLSRAERRYGVQGDRTTQELTPLPISIEDGNSDEEDQTLFEVNRQQIRIL